MTLTRPAYTIRAAHVPPDPARLRVIAQRAIAEDARDREREIVENRSRVPLRRSESRQGSPGEVVCVETGRSFGSANEAAVWLSGQVGRRMYAHAIIRSVKFGAVVEGYRFAAGDGGER